MHDYFSENFEWDGSVPRKKKRVARDRERITFPMTAMDHAALGFNPTFSDGSPDHTSPHRPGYRFADIGDAARLAADEAYEEGEQEHDEAHDQRSVRTASLDELRAKAQQAWEDRNVRMQNAWRTNKET